MIGTPNAGDPLANPFIDPCTPAASDLVIGAADTMAPRNINTQYYTIAGDWTYDPRGRYDCVQDSLG